MEEMHHTHKEPAWGWYAGLGVEVTPLMRKLLSSARSAGREAKTVWGRSVLPWAA